MESALFEQLIESVGIGVGVYDDSGRYMYVNPRYAGMLGTEPDELIGKPIWELNNEFDTDRFEQYWDSFGGGETRIAETVHRYEGAAVDVQTVTTRVDFDGKQYNLGTIQDISVRKQHETQLSQLHEVTGALIAAESPREIAEMTVNTAEEILGYDRNIIRGVTESGRLEPMAATDEAKAHNDTDRSYRIDDDSPAARAYRAGKPILIDDAAEIDDEHDRGPAGSVMYLPIGEYAVLSIANDAVASFDCTDVDLASILASTAETALRRLENERDLERQNERLEAFVDVLSHDIPNHLNVASARLELAREQGELSHLDYISTAHDRIEALISDMRMLVDHGKQIESTEWLRFRDELQLCWANCIDDTDAATLEIDSEGYLRADKSRFRQLLENLLWNAFEHAGENPTVRVGLLEDGFFIEDDGPGIPESEREKVLSPGFTTAGESGDHFGFGLAIVREIARAHDWEIIITSAKKGGARFEFAGVELHRDES